MAYLENIKTPSDLKKLNIKELGILASEIRQKIISVASNNGGHLASSLGAVDAIIALYYVFDFPKDKIIFDVGHQAYAHKILSERKELFETIRTEGGLSGFPNVFESEYDAFSVGHAGTSISAALGYCTARDTLNDDYYVISFVGDASFFNGENMEAIFATEKKPKKLLVILNDNGMSISKNNNGLYKFISKSTMKKRYSKFMATMDKIFGWNFIGSFLKGVKRAFKRSLDSYSMLDTVGIKYVGAFDGHNIKLLIDLFNSYKHSPRATLLHIKTKKGKGYEPAENNADVYHGVSKSLCVSDNAFSKAVGEIAKKITEKNDKAVFLTAGMALGTGLNDLQHEKPDKVIDVGINEEYCVTYSAGLAIAGLRPFVCMYSTFLQRSYDQVMVDVCLQNLPVVFLIDRAGLVGVDGCTHQGVFDLSYLSHIPNLTILTPKNAKELEIMIDYAIELERPVAIRYPNGKAFEFEEKQEFSKENLWEIQKEGDGKIVLACGSRMLDIALKATKNTNACVVNARSVKPLDEKLLGEFIGREMITLEDNSVIGGFGAMVLGYYAKKGVNQAVSCLGVEDKFVEHAKVDSQLKSNNLTVENLKKYL